MKKFSLFVLVLTAFMGFSQGQDTTAVYKKRVLESTEVDFLSSYYKQDGVHSSVSGGMGSEKLTDFASNIVIAIPLNADDVLTFDAGISAYTSASSSNINPFDSNTPSPWQASSGASAQDVLTSLVGTYAHTSDDRNTTWNTHISGSMEYDYSSIGLGGGIAHLFNNKNTEFSASTNVYLDTWRPIYPKELLEFSAHGLNSNLFSNIVFNPLLPAYNPSNYKPHETKNRNSYSISLGLSQVWTKKLQTSVFMDVLYQTGLLSTPYQRVYFADKENYFINEFQLADDIERLPDNRFKIPAGARLNYYVNERVTFRTYYRYYWDDWGITAHTASIEVPIKISDKFTLSPTYRYYTQLASKYFAPYETHLSTEQYYTSDYDLSTFKANQYGFGLGYVDIFTNAKIWKFGIKNIDFRFNHYDRNDGLNANIFTFGIKFVQQ